MSGHGSRGRKSNRKSESLSRPATDTEALSAEQKIVPQSLNAQAYKRAKEDIISCALPPGAEISEAILAGRYRSGKAPIRWALACLAKENLVSVRPRKGYIVAPVTLHTVRELFELRLLLEPAAAKLAAGKVDSGRLNELNRVCDAGYTPGNRASEAQFLKANKEFHVSVAKASGNQRLAAMLEGILDEMERLFHLGLAIRNRSEEMRHEHSSLIEALVSADGARAEKVTVEQIESARQMVLGALLNSKQLNNANISVA